MSAGRPRWRRAADAALVAAFVGMAGLPVARNCWDGWAAPAAAGAARAALAGGVCSRTFPDRFTTFFDENFGFRDTLLAWVNAARVFRLHVSASPRVVVGRWNWLFYQPLPAGDDYPLVRPFTPAQLAAWTRLLEARRDWLAERGIPYLVMVTPDKQTIYPEGLPRGLRRRAAEESRLDQLLAHLRARSTVRVLDVRAALRDAKARERIYNYTDSHWNGRGAFAAYACLIEALADRFPRLRPLPRSAFHDTARPVPGGDCAQLLGLADRLREECLELAPRVPWSTQWREVPGPYAPDDLLRPTALERPGDDLPRLLMFRDSFGAHMVAYLGEHFRRLVHAWERTDIPIFDHDLVLRERPDAVVQQIVERKLAVYIPNDVPDDPRCEGRRAWSRCSDRAE
jgi:hypothetical protein